MIDLLSRFLWNQLKLESERTADVRKVEDMGKKITFSVNISFISVCEFAKHPSVRNFSNSEKFYINKFNMCYGRGYPRVFDIMRGEDEYEEEILVIEEVRPQFLLSRPVNFTIDEIRGVLEDLDRKIAGTEDESDWLVFRGRFGDLTKLAEHIQNWFGLHHYVDSMEITVWFVERSHIVSAMGIHPDLFWEFYTFRQFIGVSK